MDGHEQKERFAVPRQERRAHPRVSVDEDSVLLFVAQGLPIKARIVDLGLGGCHLLSNDPFTGKVGRPVEITFKVNGVAFRFSGVVQWTDGRTQLGIHFVNMISRRKAELAEVIEEMAARAQPVNQLVAEQDAQETPPPEIPKAVSAGPVEPIAAKANEPRIVAKASEPPAAPQPAETEIPAEIAPPARPPSKFRDRRAQTRHEVDTVATIFLVKVGSALRGRILDLSPSGCRIRTDERFPVGIYTRVETEFHLEGLPFRLGGVIQAIHNRNMVGIRFLDLSERKRQQVLDLIDEMEQMRAALLSAEAPSAEKPHEADGH
jgi:c-di-GMP-binding flagellar brake protein YcgR